MSKNPSTANRCRLLSMAFIALFISFCLSTTANAQPRKAITKRIQPMLRSFQPHAFDEGWLFREDSTIDAFAADFNDTDWRTLSLPHDFAIERRFADDGMHIGPFVKAIPDSSATGHIPGGTGWYRKHFKLDEWTMQQRVGISFDGVSECSDVWLNGHHLGFHPNGYMPFQYDLTPFLLPAGQDNVIVVRAFSAGENSRWYFGAGIYRHVQLTVSGKIYIPEWETQVTTPMVDPTKSKVNISFPLQNTTNAASTVSLRLSIQLGNKVVWTKSQSASVDAGSSLPLNIVAELLKPELWSIEHPSLYTLKIDVLSKNIRCDSYETTFGIRSLHFSADQGFLLNGVPVELKGACVHHDNGLLGAAAYDGAEMRRVQSLKDNGFNAIRTSHNPPSTAFLNACDRLGMLVIDEAFDMWEKPKRNNDYHLFFKQYAEKDMASYIKRDRNHPCVILWSIGNEINERADMSGLSIASKLISVVKSLDTTRPVTEAICAFWDHQGRSWNATAPAFALLDVGGYNYMSSEYENDHKAYPSRIMAGTETFPMKAYDDWQADVKHPYVLGDFVWTGIDYIGEVGIGNAQYVDKNDKTKYAFSRPWPWFLSYCGDIDITGGKKPQSLYRDVVWGRSHLEMLVHSPIPEGMKERVSMWGWPDEYAHWNWAGNEGKMLTVHAYTDCDSVRLYLNNTLIATERPGNEQNTAENATDNVSGPSGNKLTVTFNVPYAPGELRAVAVKDGKEIANRVLQTAGKPDHIELSAERSSVANNPNDLAYIQINVVDAEGNVVPTTAVKLHISVEGDGRLLASGNAAPNDMQSFRNADCSTFLGRCLAILQPSTGSGQMTLKVSGEGLAEETLTIPVVVPVPAR